jgi:tetratricopeptide (TPR) repeat protein
MTAALFVWAIAAFGQSPGAASYERANRLFVDQKFQEALAAVDDALRRDPKLVPALTLKAKLAMAGNRFDVARESLERAIAADPTAAYAHLLYGFQFYLGNELQLAAPALEKARRLNPRDARAALYLGLTYESLGRTSEAAGLYEQAIRLEEAAGKPQAETLLTASRLLVLMDRLQDASRLIERAVKLEPDSREAHFEMARLLLKKGDAAQAVREGEAALRLAAGSVTDRQVHYLLIRACQAAGQESQADRHAAALRTLDDSGKK